MKKILFLFLSFLLSAAANAQSDSVLYQACLSYPSDSLALSEPAFLDCASPSSLKPDYRPVRRSAQRWGLKSKEYPLPSFSLSLGAGTQFPYSDNNYRPAVAYNLSLGLTPWQFRLPVRKHSFFHGGWTVGAYGDFLPENVHKQIHWQPYPGHGNITVGTEIDRDSPQWAYGYEVGTFMRLPLAWTFVPKRPDAGFWTVGFEPELRLGYINRKRINALYCPEDEDFRMPNGLNFQAGLNAFVQYRKGNWSVDARLGFAFDIRNAIRPSASLGIGYHF